MVVQLLFPLMVRVVSRLLLGGVGLMMLAIILLPRGAGLKGAWVDIEVLRLGLEFRIRIPKLGLPFAVGRGLEFWTPCGWLPSFCSGCFLGLRVMEVLKGNPFYDSQGSYLHKMSTLVVHLALIAFLKLVWLGNKWTQPWVRVWR